MKLRSQFFVSFLAVTLICIGTIASFSYKPILINLMTNQRKMLREQAVSWLTQTADGGVTRQEWQWIRERALNDGIFPSIQTLNGKFVASALPQAMRHQWQQQRTHTALWNVGGKQYIVIATAFYQDHRAYDLVLVKPLDEWSLAREIALELMIILTAGTAASILMSYFLAKHLATPLLALKQELKKTEDQRFSDVRRISAAGEVGEVAESAYHLSVKLGQYITTQKKFLRYASHELKTPLMSIRGYAEGIRDGIFVGDAVNRGLDVIVAESMRLTGIVNELILLAKLENQPEDFTFEDADVVEILSEAVQRVDPLRIDNNLTIHFRPGHPERLHAWLSLDKQKMLQAFINVLSNAIRYAKHDIEIEIAGAVKDGGTSGDSADLDADRRATAGAADTVGVLGAVNETNTRTATGVADWVNEADIGATSGAVDVVNTADTESTAGAVDWANEAPVEASDGGAALTITIADDGPGIPEDLLPHLFHQFIKGADGQTGLGLAISRAIIEHCGGTIEASNQPKGGAAIKICFSRRN